MHSLSLSLSLSHTHTQIRESVWEVITSNNSETQNLCHLLSQSLTQLEGGNSQQNQN